MRASGAATSFFRSPDRIEILAIGVLFSSAAILWWARVYNFVADDSFFYPVIARNIVEAGQQSFSGLYPTNGIHPLWLYVLTAYTAVAELVEPKLLRTTVYAIPLSLALLGAGALMSHRAARRLDLAPGVFVLVPVAFLCSFPVLYSEAIIHYAALSLLTLLVVGDSRQRSSWGLIGVAAATVFLARLDSVFFVATFFAWYSLAFRRFGDGVRAGLVAAVLVIPYLGVNHEFFGGWTPVSGWLKSTFPSVHLTGLEGSRLHTTLSNYQVVFGILPILASGLLLAHLRPRLSAPEGIVYPLWTGAFLHWTYTSLFTAGLTWWYWYYVLPVFLGSVCLGLWIRSGGNRFRHRLAVTALVLISSLALLFGHRWERFQNWNDGYFLVLDVLRDQGADADTVLVSDWPGGLAWLSEHRVMAADFLTGNRQLYAEMKESGNALTHLSRLARGQEAPLEWVVVFGRRWLRPGKDLQSVEYVDPKASSDPAPIGRLQLGSPVYTDPARGLFVWKVNGGLAAEDSERQPRPGSAD